MMRKVEDGRGAEGSRTVFEIDGHRLDSDEVRSTFEDVIDGSNIQGASHQGHVNLKGMAEVVHLAVKGGVIDLDDPET